MRALAILLAAAALTADPILAPGAKPENLGRIGAGEGPAWGPDGRLYFSGGGRITRRDAAGKVDVYRENAGANGLLFDRQGRLVACESRNRRITRTEADGTITVLTDNYEGKKYNSPNDLTIDSRGRVYFSDPRYGSRDGMEMIEGVYRIDAPGKVARVLGEGQVDRPNGVLVSAGDRYLYVADNNNNTIGGARRLWRFSLKRDGSVVPSSRRLLFDWKDGRGPDGFKTDRKGRLYVAGGRNAARPPHESDVMKAGLYVLSPEGKLLEFIPLSPDEVTNCAFGGADLRTLFVTAGGTLWSIATAEPGRIPASR